MKANIWKYERHQACDLETAKACNRQAVELLRQAMLEGAVDLHTHSNSSDGKTSPPQLVQEIMNHKLKTFALTDHDTINGIEAVSMVYEKLFQLGVELPDFIPGVELGVDLDGQEVHLLAYYPAGMIHCLDGYLAERRKDRADRNLKMCKRAREAGLAVKNEELMTEGGGTIGRVHLAQLLIRKGYVNSVDEAFNTYLKEGKLLYVKRELPEAHEAIQTVIKTGGVPVLAHPAIYRHWLRENGAIGPDGVKDKLTRLKEAGLQGVEVLHGETTPAETEIIAEITAELGLLPTAGSDYHGSHKPNVRLRNDKNEGYDILAKYFPDFRK